MSLLSRYLFTTRDYNTDGAVARLRTDDQMTVRCETCAAPRSSFGAYRNARGVLERLGAPYIDNISAIHPIWSAQLVATLQEAGITGFRAHPLYLAVIGEMAPLPDLPEYCAIEITGRVTLDLQLYNGGTGESCPACGKWAPRKGSPNFFGDTVLAIKDDAGPGWDLASASNDNLGYIFCSPRFVSLIRDSHAGGFEFRPPAPGLRRLDLTPHDWWERYLENIRTKYPALL
jgi:hypothetical protein